MSTNDGGPAFPQQMLETDRGRFSVDAWGAGGMSLRDWFAGMAIRHVGDNLRECAKAARKGDRPWAEWTEQQVAAACYGLSDAMIAQREKKP